MCKEGDQLPNEEVFEGSVNNKVHTQSLFENKKGILIGFQGAFTPICSSQHLPGFMNKLNELKTKGYDYIVCVTVNDPFVTAAWAKQFNLPNNVRIVADPCARFTKAIGMQQDFPGLGLRSKRFALVFDNNTVRKVFEEPDGKSATVSSAENVLKNL